MSPILESIGSVKGFGWGALAQISAGSYEAIATLSGTGSSQELTFSSIPSTYKHLQIRGVTAVNHGGNDYGNAGVRFNGDTAQNYTTHAMRGYWDGSANQQGLNYTLNGGLNYGMIFGAFLNPAVNTVFPVIIDILNYANTGNRKVAKAWSGSTYLNSSSADRGFLQTASTFWDSNSAINSITLFASNGTWDAKSKFTLYGIKDS